MVRIEDLTGRGTVGHLAAMLERYVAAFNAGDTAGYAACYAPDVVLVRGDLFHLRSMALYEIEHGLFRRIQATSLERTIVRKGEK